MRQNKKIKKDRLTTKESNKRKDKSKINKKSKMMNKKSQSKEKIKNKKSMIKIRNLQKKLKTILGHLTILTSIDQQKTKIRNLENQTPNKLL